MSHGVVDVLAFQEALLIEVIFATAFLSMVWVGFRRWLQHREKIAGLLDAQNAERAAHNADQMERLEARLKAVEQIVTDGGSEIVVSTDSARTAALP